MKDENVQPSPTPQPQSSGCIPAFLIVVLIAIFVVDVAWSVVSIEGVLCDAMRSVFHWLHETLRSVLHGPC